MDVLSVNRHIFIFWGDFKIPGRNHLKDSESWGWNIAKFAQKYYWCIQKNKNTKLPTALQPEALGLALASWKESILEMLQQLVNLIKHREIHPNKIHFLIYF